MATIKHLSIGKFSSHSGFVQPEIYGSVVRNNVVRACVDVVIRDEDNGEILLGKRNIEPCRDWFTFGGHIIPGEKPEQTAVRVVKEDLGLNFQPERFTFLEIILSFVSDRRNEPPQENGAHDISLLHLLSIKREELSLAVFRKTEYNQIKWFAPGQIKQEHGPFHLVLPDIIKAIKLCA